MIDWLTDLASSPRGKWVVVAAWLVVVVGVVPFAPMLADISTNDTLQFLPEDSESTRAARLVRERYPSSATPAIVVFRNENGLTDEDFAAAERVSQSLAETAAEGDNNISAVISPFTRPEARSELVSPDETTLMMIVNITGSPADAAYADRVEAIRDITDEVNAGVLQVKVSGPGGLIADLVSVFDNINSFLLLVTASLVLVLLIIIYRSPVVALVPLALVGVVFALANGLGAWILDGADFDVSGQTTGIMTVILFGAGTDYILFISSRYREELVRNEDKHTAIARSMRGVAGAVSSAAGTLVLASGILLLATLASFRSLGPAIAIAVALMLLAALTLVPAILAILGRFAFWPFRPHYDPESEGSRAQPGSRIWGRISSMVIRRPVTVLIVVVAILGALALGVFRLDQSYDSLESLPADVDSVEGYDLLREGFPAGQLAPTDVFVRFPDGTDVLEPDNLRTVAAIDEELAGMDGVAGVASVAYPRGRDGPGPDEVLAAIEAIPPPVREQIVAARTGDGPPDGEVDPALQEQVALFAAALEFLSTDRAVSRSELILALNPYGVEAMDEVESIREMATAAARDAGVPGDEPVLVGGETAENHDTRQATNRDIRVVLPLVLLSIVIVLGLLLRSVVAAVYLGATILFTYFSTLGLAVLFFEFVLDEETISSVVPFFLFVFLNALGVDYSIYLMSRIKEESEEYPLEEATERALSRTGGVITSAGLILAGTFAALMTLPLRDLLQLGFAVSTGVLMDTFITRSLIVPSIVTLLGRWNWWPSAASRVSR